jgi:hypothetical protein
MTHSEALKLALDALGKFSIGYHVDAVELNDLIATLEAALEQREPDIYSIPANTKEPRPGLVNLEEFQGFLYESKNGWHIGDMKVVKWLLDNREADYWDQFKEKV